MASGAVAALQGGARTAAPGLVGLGSRLGLIVGRQEAVASLNPADYVYAMPSEDTLKRLAHGLSTGQSGAGAPPAGSRAALQGAAALPAAAAAAAAKPAALFPLTEDLFGGHLELDDDCLRLLLGEDADETGPCASAAGSGKGPSCEGASGGGTSQKSTVTGDGAAAGEADAASVPAGGEAGDAAVAAAALREEEDDIAMLFGEYREPLDLHLLAAAHHAPAGAAADSDDTSSAAGAGCEADAEADDLASPSKRSKGGVAAAPAGLHLALSMDYEKAAESINLELLAAGGTQLKHVSYSEGFDAVLPLLSPIMDFATLSGGGSPCVDTPDSPDSLASGSDTMGPAQPADSAGKRKRAVHA